MNKKARLQEITKKQEEIKLEINMLKQSCQHEWVNDFNELEVFTHINENIMPTLNPWTKSCKLCRKRKKTWRYELLPIFEK